MRILIAGGTGAIGSRLTAALVRAGHEVAATTRHPENVRLLEDLGASGFVVDAYDAPRLAAVVAESAPELVVHELTDLSDFDLEANARIRRAGTSNLVAAARAAGVERMIAQSIAWAYVPGDAPADEDVPLVAGTAVAELERRLTEMPRSTVLRYGMFYGPGTWYAPGARMANAATAGLLHATDAVTSFVHIDDAVEATVQSIDWPDGTYNVVDDDPAPGTLWVPAFARSVGAPVPPPAPSPSHARGGRGATNATARSLGWVPRHPSWDGGFDAVADRAGT
jgi:nucleoside-diphosphate-sugar epimerase